MDLLRWLNVHIKGRQVRLSKLGFTQPMEIIFIIANNEYLCCLLKYCLHGLRVTVYKGLRQICCTVSFYKFQFIGDSNQPKINT